MVWKSHITFILEAELSLFYTCNIKESKHVAIRSVSPNMLIVPIDPSMTYQKIRAKEKAQLEFISVCSGEAAEPRKDRGRRSIMTR